jgi:hypothetical protein
MRKEIEPRFFTQSSYLSLACFSTLQLLLEQRNADTLLKLIRPSICFPHTSQCPLSTYLPMSVVHLPPNVCCPPTSQCLFQQFLSKFAFVFQFFRFPADWSSRLLKHYRKIEGWVGQAWCCQTWSLYRQPKTIDQSVGNWYYEPPNAFKMYSREDRSTYGYIPCARMRQFRLITYLFRGLSCCIVCFVFATRFLIVCMCSP